MARRKPRNIYRQGDPNLMLITNDGQVRVVSVTKNTNTAALWEFDAKLDSVITGNMLGLITVGAGLNPAHTHTPDDAVVPISIDIITPGVTPGHTKLYCEYDVPIDEETMIWTIVERSTADPSFYGRELNAFQAGEIVVP